MLVSLLVALTVTPALCLMLLSRAPARRARESPLLRVLKRRLRRAARAVSAGPARRSARDRLPVGGRALFCPTLGSQLLPNFKERDFLMHWVDEAGHVGRCEETRISVRGLQGPAGRSPESATAARTSARRWSPTRCTASTSGRTGSASTRTPTTTRRWPPCTGRVDGYPGLYRDVQTYLRERIKEVLTGTSESIVVRIFGPDLDGAARQGGRGRGRDRARSTGSSTPKRRARRPICRTSQVRARPATAARSYGLKPGDIRRQASTLIASEEVGDIFDGGRSTTCTSGASRARATA